MSNHRLKRNTFIADVLLGKALEDDVDDYIDEWHDNDYEVGLHDFLGMSRNEYALFVEQPKALGLIIHSKAYDIELTALLGSDEIHRMAARSLKEEDGLILLHWLIERGYLNSV